MASDVMSLFGMDPSILQQQQNQGAIDQASRMNANFAAGAAGGQLMGSAVNSAFGLQTPEMAQAQQVQDSMRGQDLTTAAGMRAAASQLMMNGNYAQAMTLHAKASEMEAEELAASNTAADREFGVLTDVNVDTNRVDDMGIPIYRKRKVRIVQDGEGGSRAFDVITGEDLTDTVVNTDAAPQEPNAAALLEALKNGGDLPAGSTVTAEEALQLNETAEIVKAKDAKIQEHINALMAQISELPESMQGSPRVIQIQEKIMALRAQQSDNPYPSSGTESSYSSGASSSY